MNLTPKNNVNVINHFLTEVLDLKIYKHKFLSDYINQAIKGVAPLYNLSILNTTDTGWILILHGKMLLIYGENWSEAQFQELTHSFNLNAFTNFTLTGDKELIDRLIEFYKPKNIQIVKRRLFYQTEKVNTFNLENLEIRLGTTFELDELSKMLQQYYHEEYNGTNDKTIEDMKQRIISLINKDKIYILIDENKNLVSFCSIIDPDIGIMFTKTEHRRNGYAKIILSYCSKLLQQKNNVVYVMTDSDNIASNKVCAKVGFLPHFNYVMLEINSI